MGVRNAMRYIGLMLLLAVYIASGWSKITNPSYGAALLARSNFPYFLSIVGVSLAPDQYQHLIQATGVIFLSFSLFILLGVGRTFFSFLLAIQTLFISFCFFVNVRDPRATSDADQQHFLTNLALVGALLFVSASGHRSRQYSEAKAQIAVDRQKKRQ